MRFSIISVAAAVCIVAGVQAAPAGGAPAAGAPAGASPVTDLVSGGPAAALTGTGGPTAALGGATKLVGPGVVPGLRKRAAKGEEGEGEESSGERTGKKAGTEEGGAGQRASTDASAGEGTQQDSVNEKGSKGFVQKITNSVSGALGPSAGMVSTNKLANPATNAVDSAATKVAGGQGNQGVVGSTTNKLAVV